MSACDCLTSPCSCTPLLSEEEEITTYCDLYVQGTRNCWVVKGKNPGDEKAPGICMLDTMTKEQVIYTLERNEMARADLKKVTSDPDLLKLADTVKRLPIAERSDVEQALGNRPNDAASIPFYSLFRGKPPMP